MTPEESSKLIDIHKELEDAMSMKIKISHEQVMFIVASDLLKKYTALLERNRPESCTAESAAFETVLCYYYGKDELVTIKESVLNH